MEIRVNERYKVRSDGGLNWLPYRLSKPKKEDGKPQWVHMGSYHQSLKDCLVSLYRKMAMEDESELDSVEEAIKKLEGFKDEIVAAAEDASAK